MVDFIFVHYHAIEWLKAQANAFKICNPNRNYRIIVVDGTGTDNERSQLIELKTNGFIDTLIFYKALTKDPGEGSVASSQHAEGINIAFQEVKNNLFCVQDCDFIWTIKGFVEIAEYIFSNSDTIIFGPIHQVRINDSKMHWNYMYFRNKIAPLFNKPYKNEWKSPILLGAFLNKSFIINNNLNFDYSYDVYKLNNYDVAFRVHQLIDKIFSKQTLCLWPYPIEQFRRGYMCAYNYRYKNISFARHLLSGTLSRESFKSDELFEQTKTLKSFFIQEALKTASDSIVLNENQLKNLFKF